MKSDLFRHPLFLLLMGTLLGSLVIPYINARSSRAKMLQESKFALATELLNQEMEISIKMNALKTSLELFQKDLSERTQNDPELIEEQKQMRRKMNEMYLSFDQCAWFWTDTFFQKIKNSDIPEKKIQEIQLVLDDCKKSLVAWSDVLDEFWSKCLRKTYDPVIVKEIMIRSRKVCGDVIKKRKDSAFKVAYLIAHS